MSTAEVDLSYAPPPAMRRRWWVLLIVGIFWLMVSLVLFRFDVSSVRAVGVITGVVFIAWGVEEFALMMVMGSAEDAKQRSMWRWLHGVLGMFLFAGGIVALANPINTFVSIAALIGWILLFKGIFDVVLALSNRDVELWWTRLVLGIVTMLFAVVVSGNFVAKAVFLVAFVAAGTLMRGIGNIASAFQLRSMK
jgi:uncharacterized membrane protein HdeD (DUF308 family)